jgi:hypothetical protein
VENEVRVTAIVQHVTPGEFMGLRFTQMSPTDADAIRQFVEKT